MESVTSLLSGAWEWIKGLDPTSDAGRRHRDGVRRKLTDEFAKPAGERDEKRLQALLWEDTRLHGVYYNCMGRYWEEEATHHLELSKRRDGCGCCTPSARVQARAAAFYTAAAAFYSAVGSQALEELRAIDAGRPAVLWELPTFQPELPASWVQHPPGRLEMCKQCAALVEELESTDRYLRLQAAKVEARLRRRGLLPAADPGAGQARQGQAQASQPDSPPQQHESPPVQERRLARTSSQ